MHNHSSLRAHSAIHSGPSIEPHGAGMTTNNTTFWEHVRHQNAPIARYGGQVAVRVCCAGGLDFWVKVSKLFGVVGCCDLLGLNQSKCGGACPQPRSQHMPRRFDHHCISSGNTRAHWLRSNRNNRTLIKHHPSIRNRLRSRSARADINMAQHHLCLLFRRWNLRGLPG